METQTQDTAISTPATRSALRDGAVWPWAALLGGVISIPAVVVCIELGGRDYNSSLRILAALGCGVAVLLFCAGVVGASMVWIRSRVRRALRQFPWTAWQVGYIADGRYDWIELRDPMGQPVSHMIVSSWKRGIGIELADGSATVWFAGDPRKWGVISAPGGGSPLYAYTSKGAQPPDFTVPANNQEHHIKRTTEPARHGSKDDSRYPSARRLRRALAFILDWSLHFGSAVAVLGLGKGHITAVGAVALGTWLAASFINRVLLQSLIHTTIGKALFGLCAIDPDTGSYPSYRKLAKLWSVDLYLSLALPMSIAGNGLLPDNFRDYFLPAVRRCDI